MVEDAGFDGWADITAQRQAEDDALVQRYAAGEGRGQDMRPVRGFVRHVRRDIGPKGVICRVRMTENPRGHEICVWFHFPQDGRPAGTPQTVTVTEARTPADGLPAGRPGTGLTAPVRAAATAPPGSAPRPRTGPGTAATSSA
jgi:hypothetical protein